MLGPVWSRGRRVANLVGAESVSSGDSVFISDYSSTKRRLRNLGQVFKVLIEISLELSRCRPWSSVVIVFVLATWSRALELVGRKMNHSTMFLSSQGTRIV